MKTAKSIYSCLIAALLMVLSSGGIAAALEPSNTQLGTGALASVTTGTDDTALGANALKLDAQLRALETKLAACRVLRKRRRRAKGGEDHEGVTFIKSYRCVSDRTC